MLKVEIKTQIPDTCILKKIIDENLEIDVEGFLSNEELVKVLFKIKTCDKRLKDLSNFCEWIKLGRNSFRVLLKDHPCSIALSILKSGGIIKKLKFEKDKIVWNIICDNEAFFKIIKNLNEDCELIYKGKIGLEKEITIREEEILKIALEKGFFDYPKKIKLKDLAEELNLSPSTLSEIMRRGLKKVLKEYFYQ